MTYTTIDTYENNTYYIEQYYKEVLSKLDPEKVYKDLKHSFLLCYEDNNEFCHRHIVAKWLELSLGIYVPEIKLINDEIKEVSRPKYIGDTLESLMKLKGHELKK